MPQPRILFENDSRHTLIYMYEPPISVEDHRQAVDELLGTPVEALLFNLGYGNAFLHGTEAGDRWGPDAFATEPFRPGGGRQWEHLVFMRAYRNAAKLIAEGNDPLRLVCERAHQHGLLLYPSLQGNAALPEKELTIGAGAGLDDGLPGAQLGDFRHPEVRDRRLALIEEVVGNYERRRLRAEPRPLRRQLFLPPGIRRGQGAGGVLGIPRRGERRGARQRAGPRVCGPPAGEPGAVRAAGIRPGRVVPARDWSTSSWGKARPGPRSPTPPSISGRF